MDLTLKTPTARASRFNIIGPYRRFHSVHALDEFRKVDKGQEVLKRGMFLFKLAFS